MLNDTDNFSLQVSRTCSVVEQVLEITNFTNTKLKSFTWMAKMICLSPSTQLSRDRNVLREVQVNAFSEQGFRYVTVSYPWHPAPYESGRCRSFWIQDLAGQYSPNIVRDTILCRVVGYVLHHDLDGFWIDRQCLDQNDEEAHQTAMHAMDRLYAQSPYSIGMVTEQVDCQWKHDALAAVLNGSMFEQGGEQLTVKLPSSQVHCGFWRAFRWFVRLLADPWWRRSWIFQEEYCAGKKMHLLIRCTPEVHNRHLMFGTLQNELELCAVQLRTQLTIFAEACCRDTRLSNKERHFIRKKILIKAERYKVLFQKQWRWNHNLSTAIMTDLKRRRVKRPKDLLPISANCCSYAQPLDEKALDEQNHISLGLALFVQALLNGEVLDNRDVRRGPFRGPFTTFFRQHVLTGVHPPEEMYNLTFDRHCRFTKTSICLEGIRTIGRLWQTYQVLNTDKIKQRSPNCDSTKKTSLLSSMWTDLKELADILVLSYPSLADELLHFMAQMQHNRESSFRDKYMTSMAREVATAWAKRRPLIIARSSHNTDNDRVEYGIFVPQKVNDPPQWIFTSWHNATDIQVSTPEGLDKHVLLELCTEPTWDADDCPRLVTKRWTNGICFFRRRTAREVIFPWPKRFFEMAVAV